jgi:hypothetical protein
VEDDLKHGGFGNLQAENGTLGRGGWWACPQERPQCIEYKSSLVSKLVTLAECKALYEVDDGCSGLVS